MANRGISLDRCFAPVLVAMLAASASSLEGADMADDVQINPATDASQPPQLVYLFPGVEGGPFIMQPAVKGLRKGGVTGEIRVHNWRRLFGVITNLISYQDNLRMAADVAAKIQAYRDEHPDAIIDLVGYSGGGGLAIMVAEALPEDIGIRNIVMCQPALSPDYDLTKAITRVQGRMINLYSRLDWAILGLGTTCLGTMDRKYVASAGKNGFDEVQAIPDPRLRERFIQCAWRGEDVKYWHFGGHLSILTYHWNKARVAPALRRDLPDKFKACDETSDQSPSGAPSAD